MSEKELLEQMDFDELNIEFEDVPDEEEFEKMCQEDEFFSVDGTRQYFETIKAYGTLNRDEEQELFRRIKQGDQEAVNLMILHNLKLSVYIAKRFHSTSPSIDFDDLIQEGNLGIMRAIETFDESKGTKFSTYAYQWIRQRIERYLSNNDKIIRLPVHSGAYLRTIVKLLDKAEFEKQDALTAKEKEAIIEEYRKKKNITKESVQSLLECMNCISLNTVIGEEDHGEISEIGDFVASEEPSPEEIAEKNARRTYLEEMMSACLNPREQEVIKLRFGFIDGTVHTLDEIGKMMGVTRERIRQIETASIKKLRTRRMKYNIQNWK